MSGSHIAPYDRIVQLLRRRFRPVARLLVNILYSPVPIASFLLGESGSQYGVGVLRKLWLLWESIVSVVCVRGATSWVEHIVLMQGVLDVPISLEGDVLEVGCYQGRSAVSLSCACALTGRRLVICDTFAGLPAPGRDESVFNLQSSEKTWYGAGQYVGKLDEVKNNIRRHGRLDVCEFVPGRAEETLSVRPGKYVLIFEDVDLPSVVKSIVLKTWRQLAFGCKFFTHEAPDYPVAQLFYDREWWQENLNVGAPGLVGAGVGLPLGPNGSGLGFAVRRSQPLYCETCDLLKFRLDRAKLDIGLCRERWGQTLESEKSLSAYGLAVKLLEDTEQDIHSHALSHMATANGDGLGGKQNENAPRRTA